MTFKVVLIFSAICLLINSNIADAANIISGNNLRNNAQNDATSVAQNGYGRNGGGAGLNVNGGQSQIRSSVSVDANGNRQSSYAINSSGRGPVGLNVGAGNSQVSLNANPYGPGSSLRVGAGNAQVSLNANGGGLGYNVRPYGPGGADNTILGGGNRNNVQTSIRG